ncbi:MAG: hypothetical protein BAJALOKI1v1_550003 [Promethearchaeota archaeon]|nr:MAG: hypothetical protein BAJALOKI1v1_550003 [Candidatus Lokiarchaeota archaeon]
MKIKRKLAIIILFVGFLTFSFSISSLILNFGVFTHQNYKYIYKKPIFGGEIQTANAQNWSHAQVISDNVNGTLNWNSNNSYSPSLAVDSSGNLHAVWHDGTNLEGCGFDYDIFYANYSVATSLWSHAHVISDNVNGTINWNTGHSINPSLTVDDSGNIYVIWEDETNLEGCDTDSDIFYANYSVTTGMWSHAQVISDNVNGTANWNNDTSENAEISINGSGNIHVVWQDRTNLEGCDTDLDIFYANYSVATELWSHAQVISDNVNGTTNWNDYISQNPNIAVDSYGNIHVVWDDKTNLEGCDTDSDIFYANYSTATGLWSHAQVISDNVNGTINWNTGHTYYPSIAIDGSEDLHVVWHDSTDLNGCSNADYDIFYTTYSTATGLWSQAQVISDNVNGTTNWNTGNSFRPSIAIDGSENLHVVWQDLTNLEGCATDYDIFYTNYSTATGLWSHAQVISDNVNGTTNWNTENSQNAKITIDGSGSLHVTWQDGTNLEGCEIDFDIFYSKKEAIISPPCPPPPPLPSPLPLPILVLLTSLPVEGQISSFPQILVLPIIASTVFIEAKFLLKKRKESNT